MCFCKASLMHICLKQFNIHSPMFCFSCCHYFSFCDALFAMKFVSLQVIICDENSWAGELRYLVLSGGQPNKENPLINGTITNRSLDIYIHIYIYNVC